MTARTKRLQALEQPAIAAWREQWNSFYDCVFNHSELLAPIQDHAEGGALFKTQKQLDNAALAMCERVGLDPLYVTYGVLRVADPDTPDLTYWLKDLPSPPPPEPPEAFKTLQALSTHDDLKTRFTAAYLLFIVGVARGHREYIEAGKQFCKADIPRQKTPITPLLDDT